MNIALSNANLKIEEISVAFRFGAEDATNGLDIYIGLDYFTYGSRQWHEYVAGWEAASV